MPFLRLSVLAVCAVLSACATSGASRSPSPPISGTASGTSSGVTSPRLVVAITIDQMRPDYFTRFGNELTGGLHRLYRDGAVFTDAVHDHANTETAPGHAATLSGRFPVHTGIASNSDGVGDTTVRLIGAPDLGASPWRFRGTTFADWLRAADPQARTLSISKKDRAAILPNGKTKTPVFWYASNGLFTTSTYYADTLPGWVQEFNAQRKPQHYVGQVWTPQSPNVSESFRHILPDDSSKITEALAPTPWMDQLTLEAALAGVRALQLGADAHTDLLAISLSATDYVGHKYGPDSPEVHDQVVRLDALLGAFFDTLFTLCDSTAIVVTLTGDHGVGPVPGTKSVDPNEHGQWVDVAPMMASLRQALEQRGVAGKALAMRKGVVSVDREALVARGVDADVFIAQVRDSLQAQPGILRVDRISELQRADTVHDAIARRWLHIFADESVAALVVTIQPYSYWGRPPAPGERRGGEHGTPYDYDARVPLIFYGAPFKPGFYAEPARVVDLAPTLAAALGIRVLERVDGRVLEAASY